MTSSASLPAYAAAVKRQDPDRFLTALFAPPARRDVLLLLYAFNHELARARAVASEPLLALIRLQWWREVVEGERKRHEVASPLSDALEAGLLARADLLEMIEARELEAGPAIPDQVMFARYLDGSAGALAVAAARLLGDADPERARPLGRAYGLAGQLRGVASLAAQGRCQLPEDVLGRHGLGIHDVIADPVSDAMRAVRAELAAEGLASLQPAHRRFSRASIAAALPGALARRDLRRLGVVAGPRGLGDKLAVMRAAFRGWV